MIINTLDALRLCQRGVKNSNPAVAIAAESVLSFVVLHLKHKRVQLPDALVAHHKTLERTVFTQ